VATQAQCESGGEPERELKSAGRRCGLLRGWALPFIGSGEAVVGWQWVELLEVNGVNDIEGGAGLRGVPGRGFDGGGVTG
jgi:hypothetical protein